MGSLETQLITAVRDGDIKNVKALLNKGANVNVVSSSGRTPLGTAAQMGSIPMIELLLSVSDNASSHDIESVRRNERRLNNLSNDSNENNSRRKESNDDNKRNLGYFVMVHDDETGVSMTSEIGDEGDSLMDENENESLCMDDAQTPDGMEDLEWDVEVKEVDNMAEDEEDLWACQYRWYAHILDKTCCILVEAPRKCDINLQDMQGRSAVHYAAKQGHLDALQLLTRAGCQVDLGDADNHTPLHLAAARDHVNVAELLISCGAGVNRKTSDKMSPLHFAAARGFKEMVILLLNSGAHINSLDSSDRTPLFYAVSRSQIEVVEILLKHGAKVNIEEIHVTDTPLHVAAAKGLVNVAELLMSCGAGANQKTRDKMSPLHFAAAYGYQELVILLLNSGAHVNSSNNLDRTPLFFAVSRCQIEIVEILLEHGAKVNIEDFHGYTPMCEAVWCKNVNLARMLLEAGAKLTQSHHLLQYAILHRHFEMAELLLSAGSIANLKDDNGDTPLIIAARTGQDYMAQLLLQKGAKVNVGNGITGSTPLHEAVQNIRDSNYPVLERFVRVLQKYGASLDRESWTARDTALTRALHLERYKAAALLIRIGANVNKCSDTGVFIFDNLLIARSKKQFPLVQMIVYAGYNLRNCSLVLPSSHYVKAIDDWIHYMRTNPMQLTELCRLRIRQDVGDQISMVVNTLQIPRSLKQFLMLEDIAFDDEREEPSLFI
ncbi:uncharacterized protein LOC142319717 isoform X1 [Lycorma delicatula]|uniref:uncharacterized protein LOC142319717 isoform X1 n=1 Tax=Lycorma delicatula TaxID=130591 RepID=UPI003F51A257